MYSINERKQHWHDFVDLKSNVNFIYQFYYSDSDINNEPKKWREFKQERIDWILRKYEFMLKHAQTVCDDRVPHLDMMTGTEIFAEALGSRVYKPDDNNPFAIPFIHKASEVSKVKVPKLEESSLWYLFEIADKTVEKAGKDAILKFIDIQSPMDIVALIWDKNDLFPAMIEEPEAVFELCDKTYEILTAFVDEWKKRYGKQFVAHYPEYYMNEGLSVSEDEVGAVSPDMFVKFFLPYLNKLSQRYGGLGIHCCANSRHQWDNFKKIENLKLLNIDIFDPNRYNYFKDTCAGMHTRTGAEKVPDFFKDKGHQAVSIYVSNREQAEEMAKTLQEAISTI